MAILKLKGNGYLLITGCLILTALITMQTELSATGLMQDVKAILFNEVNQIRSEAKNAKADILAPQSYGKATMEARYYDFLGKVINAIATFPNSSITIEGHTDSFGSDETNLALSRKRAEAVTQYLISNMQIDPSRISSIGFGESRPLASNETEEGRAKNRRIEIKIHPQFEEATM